MAFLILTATGLEAFLELGPGATGPVAINPALATDAMLAQLRDAGVSVHVLQHPVDPHDEDEVAAAVQEAEQGGGTVWLERGPAPVVSGTPARSLRRRLGSNAGAAWRFLDRQLGGGRHLMIVPYLGFGNARMVSIRGRVLDEIGFRAHSLQDSAWRNVAALYQRLESDQVAGAKVRANFHGVEGEAVTDGGGYFTIDLALPAPMAESGWQTVQLTLVDTSIRAVAEVLIAPASARFGVISDIDDTVLWTNVTNKLNMALTLARSNPFTRKPFKGVAALYRALHAGAGGNEGNPVFYVSSSPWHLFDPLVEFMRLQNIPLGPLMLRELSVRALLKPAMSRNHKLDKIEKVLRTYPDLPFVLIGDSGERDPEIYAEVVRRHPRAVKVIYIRNVNPDPARIDALDRLAEQVAASGAQLVLTSDSAAVAAHAVAAGLIAADAMAAVRAEKLIGDRPPGAERTASPAPPGEPGTG
ncbi:App1 family protein [Massilia sp. S19_KUP03_FR1]|uniref:App1 family protein n=1 Tax=Massilia sp. S19_KUP03_FR1 TaxID=3025503 RepID=UPI002FCD54A3